MQVGKRNIYQTPNAERPFERLVIGWLSGCILMVALLLPRCDFGCRPPRQRRSLDQ